jgi:acetyl esterase/lipase
MTVEKGLDRRELLALAAAAPWMRPGGRTTAGTESMQDASARRRELYGLLGDLPDRQRPISGRQRAEEKRDGFVLETWDLDLNGIETVPAFVARPVDAAGRRPAVVFNHSHGGGYTIGKQEFLDSRTYLQPEPYAVTLTRLGCVAVCIDHWVFGERAHTSELDMFKASLWQGEVLWGKMVYDSLRTVDWLVARSDVDGGRIGTLGMSMGSSMAQWLAALDVRIKATVDICCLTDYHTLLARKGLGGHGVYYYVPALLKHFTASQINALIAPRAHLAIEGTQDKLAPIDGVELIDRELTRVYAAAGAPGHWQLRTFDVGHQETPEGRAAAVAFLHTFL